MACTMEADTCRIQGNNCYKDGMYNEAIEWYTKAIDMDEANPSLYGNRSAAYLMVQKFTDAYKDANKSISLDPKNVKYMLRCAKCCVNLGKIDEAKRVCCSVREVDPNNVDVITINHGIELLSQNYESYLNKLSEADFGHALYLITNCISFAPASINYNLQRLHVLIQLKRFTEAKHYVEKLLKVDDNCVEFLFYRGLCLYYMEHLDKAIIHFQHVLRLNPDHTDTQKAYKRAKTFNKLKEKGNQCIQNTQYSKAYETYTEALQLDHLHDPLNAKLFSNRACALFYLNRFEEAIDDCNSAIALDPKYIKARIRRAKCFTSIDEFQKAVEEWDTIVALDDSNENRRCLQTAKSELERSKKRDYYKILGLKKNASSDEIKQAYKRNALLHHPDRHTNADANTRLQQETKFKEVGEAYSVLSDPKKRRLYDMGELSATDDVYRTNETARAVFTQVFPGMGSTRIHFCFS